MPRREFILRRFKNPSVSECQITVKGSVVIGATLLHSNAFHHKYHPFFFVSSSSTLYLSSILFQTTLRYVTYKPIYTPIKLQPFLAPQPLKFSTADRSIDLASASLVMSRRGRRKAVNSTRRRDQGSVEWQIIECSNRVQEVAAPLVDFLGVSRDRAGTSDGRELGFLDRSEIGLGGMVSENLALIGGGRSVVNVDEEGLGSGIGLMLFEKWRGRISDNSGLDTDLCLLSNFANDKMLWERVVARVRLEALYKPRFGRDSVNWRNWFVEPAKIVDDVRGDVWLPCGEVEEVTTLFEFVKEIEKEVNVKKLEFDGPFGEAYKRMVMTRERENKEKDKGLVKWTPAERRVRVVFVPSLSDLSFGYLSEYCEGLVSLENVPLEIRHKLCRAACDYGKMNFEFMKIVVNGAPSEICVPDCCWMTTKKFSELFFACDFKNLKVLHLEMGAQCNFDHAFMSDVFPPRVFRALESLSLKGAVQLTDKGLGSLVQLAPSLRSLDISRCPLICAMGIHMLAIWYGKTLKELYIDDCPAIDAMAMLPALTKFLNLQVLSVAGNYSVCDEFVRHFIDVRGSSLKELVFSSCKRLTDETIKILASTGSSLVSLDVSNMSNLTDWTLQYIANGFGSIRHLELSHNSFSDAAVAALLEVSGQFLTELSLKDNKKIGPATVFSLANFARNLLSLDLSQCDLITDDMLGQIVNCCTSLKLLKIFGCPKITKRFLNGHTNQNLEIVGASPMLQKESAR